MKHLPLLCGVVLLLSSVLFLPCTMATEFFVNKTGDDQNNGRSAETAFLTVQHGVDTLEPGDTLVIGPGEYFEAISREDLGDTETETVIRAEIPGTVLIHGNVPVFGFEKVEGTRFIYVTDFDHQPYSLAEVDSLKLLNEALYLDELEFLPGTYFYDVDAGKLYLSSTDLQPPPTHHYRAAVIPESGIYLRNPVRVILEGIATTGFHFNEALPLSQGATMWGIFFSHPRDCVIRDCVAYLNGGGILMKRSEGGNVIENCTAYANNSRHNNEGGNIAIIRGGEGDILRGNYVYRSPGYGQRFYISEEAGKLMETSVGWGNESGDLWVKGVREPYEARGLISLGSIPVGSVDSVGGSSGRLRDIENTIFLRDDEDLVPEAEFADPVHFDFRLQSTSRFRGAGEEGRDLGPFPFSEEVFFVGPTGDDANDGLSVASAWRTFAHAFEELQPGQTLYILGGRYEEEVSGSLEDVTIRGRGGEPVLLAGAWTLDGANGVTLQRLTFLNPLTVAQGGNLHLDNCVFWENGTFQAREIAGVEITHSVFESPIELTGCDEVRLLGNLYAMDPALVLDQVESVAYSNYNSYPTDETCWKIGDRPLGLAELPGPHDGQSMVATPEIVLTDETIELANRGDFAGRGPLGKAIGLYFEGETRSMELAGPFLHSVTDTTANIEWWTGLPAVVEFSWGTTEAMENSLRIHHHYYGGYSLTGLEPGQTYFYQVRLLEPFPGLTESQWVDFPEPTPVPGRFTTKTDAPEPRAYYVAPDGDDARDGASLETAWATLNQAAREVGPGDTVHVAPGRYSETVWLRATGDEGRPITWRGSTRGRTVFDGASRKLFGGFVGQGKHHQRFDAFYAEDLGHISTRGGSLLVVELGGMFVLAFSDHIDMQRCLLDGRGVMYSPSILSADSCADLLMKNCVVMNSMDRARVVNSPRVRIENSVFFRNLISCLLVENHFDQQVVVARNLFTDVLPNKFGAPTVVTGRRESLLLEDNCFFVRPTEDEKTLVMIYSDEAFERVRIGFLMGEVREEYPVLEEIVRLTLKTLPDFYGETGSFIADPGFPVLADREGEGVYAPDRLGDRAVDFNSFFATNPEVMERGAGLQPAAFDDFDFENR